ncbi:DUF1580 domain-containing protein [Botrimarina hoheduenensis]|uniref:DUF1580 domain-containing protein n=1 Tax=Botrimarina hoheduenensis TaxID=2528000 RepID=A0A5C5WFW6_9BACT|nr:DUF1580 domain-containing protein [Botrimarina hoheduenensis]TWT49001.1 hypothetical protein Pla111_07790 [Botrimarina hoheduenensis]
MTGHTLHDEKLISIREVPDFLPTRRGKKLHISTVHRWVQKGARGKVLESVMLGGVRYTSLEALVRFMTTSTVDLVEFRRHQQIREDLSERGLINPRATRNRIPGRDSDCLP